MTSLRLQNKLSENNHLHEGILGRIKFRSYMLYNEVRGSVLLPGLWNPRELWQGAVFASIGGGGRVTILTEMMGDEFNFLRPEIKNYKAEADADLIPIPDQLELHGRCRCGVLLSTCFCALFVADLIVGMEESELYYRCRGRFNLLRKIKIATISVRMVPYRQRQNCYTHFSTTIRLVRLHTAALFWANLIL